MTPEEQAQTLEKLAEDEFLEFDWMGHEREALKAGATALRAQGARCAVCAVGEER